MTNRSAALIGASLTAAMLLGSLGPPRLLGTGCKGRPLGLSLAREESDMPRCASIRPIISLLTE